MHKRILVLFFFLIFYPALSSQIIKPESNQTEVKEQNIVEEWQTNPESFAKLFYGNDLSKGSTNSGSSLRETKKAVIENVIGSYVEWPLTFGIWPPWLNSSKEGRKRIDDNTSIHSIFGPDSSVWFLTDRLMATPEIQWKRMTWGIPPQSDVHLKMKLERVNPVISRQGKLILWIEGSEFEIMTSSKRCDWPEYNSKIYASRPIGNLPVYNSFEILVNCINEFPVKVGIRSEDEGIDFIVPSKGEASVLVPKGTYEIYFQFTADPSNLYQGDSLNVEDSGFEIHLKGKEAGEYKIRKIK